MADQITFNPLRAADGNGTAVPAAEARFFLTGTTTPAIVYTDPSATVAHPTPLVADGSGMFPQIFSGQQLKVEVRSPIGAMLPGYPLDPVIVSQTSGAGAGTITFSPTASIPVTNVQAAIERVQANIVGPANSFGLGVTGSVTALTNIDATNTASGTYRVDGATTGTLPAGITAASGGIVLWHRETAAEAWMTLLHGVDDRKFSRDMAAGIWGAWREEAPSQTDAAWIAGASTTKGVVGPDQIKLAIAAQAVQLGGRSARVTPGAVASYDFTGIPAGVNTLTVALDQVSGTTTAYTYVQLGAGGVVETTGYVCTAAQNSGGATTSATSTTSNFHAMDNNSATTRVTGVMQFVRLGATDTWVGSGSISDTQVVRGGSFGGVKTLAGTLDRIRIGVESGNFDGGSFSVSWGY